MNVGLNTAQEIASKGTRAVKSALKLGITAPTTVRRLISPVSKKAGLPPGSLVHVGPENKEPIRIDVFDFAAEAIEERDDVSLEDAIVFPEKGKSRWVNVVGVHDPAVIESIGQKLEVHSLVLEDIMHTEQRPKMEDHERYLYVVLRMLQFNDEHQAVESEQISLLLFDNLVVSFQEAPGDVFDSVRERLRLGRGKLRKNGVDYLKYALMDAIVDHYFVILERFGEVTEDLELLVLRQPRPETVRAIQRLKGEMILMRKSVWPLREVISGLERGESKLIKKETRLYLRDLYDHSIQVIDAVETFRDVLSVLMDLYLSSVSNRMNNVMKTLTVIATIFMPLTLLTGIYGMNFQYMPELAWKYSYPVLMGIMVAVAGGLALFFKKKGWF
ncbi:magnesium/cobalt transporter CorA [bacterium]|nr:magnesium/cobalt transporter CorA [bacterium]